MELTSNLPPKEWYIETSNNNLTYWRIDYPPLTAYHSLILGHLSSLFEPKSMELVKSHGYETNAHKAFMRASVLISDILFLTSIVVFIFYNERKKIKFVKLFICFLTLFCPPFILIDHGHFQYNCVALGIINN